MQGADRSGVDWERVLDGFAVALHVMENRLAGRVTLERLDADRLLTHLHQCLTGLTHPVRTPPHGSYLNAVLADQELVGGFEPRIGRMVVRAVAVHGYRNELALVSGVPAGAQVVTAGVQKMAPGLKVAVPATTSGRPTCVTMRPASGAEMAEPIA